MSILSDELTNDPLGRVYSGMADQQVVDSMNALDRPAKGGVSGMFNYLLENTNRSNAGTDTTQTPILGRLHHVANSNIGDDPFGSLVLVTLVGKHAAQAFIDLLLNPQLQSIDFESANLPYARCTGMEIWSAADVTALKALSQNKQSRARELELPKVKIGHVTEARG